MSRRWCLRKVGIRIELVSACTLTGQCNIKILVQGAVPVCADSMDLGHTYMYHRNATGYHGYITFILLTGRAATAVSQAAEGPIHIATATSRPSAADPGQY